MAASANNVSNERRYICTSVIITPASKRPAQWGNSHEIPESESLPYGGSTQEGVRKEFGLHFERRLAYHARTSPGDGSSCGRTSNSNLKVGTQSH